LLAHTEALAAALARLVGAQNGDAVALDATHVVQLQDWLV
jgi:kynureninase